MAEARLGRQFPKQQPIVRAESAFERTSAQLQVLLAVAMQLGGLGIDVIEMSPGHPGLPFNNRFSLHISSYRSSLIPAKTTIALAGDRYLRKADNALAVSRLF
jgi:hypothetical protein